MWCDTRGYKSKLRIKSKMRLTRINCETKNTKIFMKLLMVLLIDLDLKSICGQCLYLNEFKYSYQRWSREKSCIYQLFMIVTQNSNSRGAWALQWVPALQQNLQYTKNYIATELETMNVHFESRNQRWIQRSIQNL